MNTFQLSNGLRIIHLANHSQVIYCGYQIAAGTRHEPSGKEGLAHFVEHATFKGTQRRNALQVINALETVGGELNAYTGKESTTYYAAVLKEHLPRAVDLLSDIVFRSVYPEAELEKEKEVVVEEIESYNDNPSELIYDEFENLIFGQHPLGHNILGSIEHVRQFSATDAQLFARRFYQPANAIFFAYGDLDFPKLVRLLEKHTGSTAASSPCQPAPIAHAEEGMQAVNSTVQTTMTPSPSGRYYSFNRQTHQAHVMVGTQAYSLHHPQRIVLYLLNNLLGGPGMNSRLNISLREKRGLVYTVESTMTNYSDTGAWSVYFGCDHTDVKRCLRLVMKELEQLQKSPISSRALAQAKQQLKGQIGIATDNHEGFALDFGKAFLTTNKGKDVAELFREIDSVTAEQLQQVAQDLFAADKLVTLVYTNA